MSIKYELSLWRDYPGSSGIREEKLDILAATGMDFAGRAQNIVLRREYTGKITLDFEIPVKYFDPFTGETVINPLCKKVVEKTKLKLWRDELWWNPFGGESVYDTETKCTKYTGKWEQGRWYDLIVNSHREKRSKKQLFYSFTCNSLFMDELSRNGYSLQFVPNTDVMQSNGMGTAHDLAERVVEGTDWEYVKTEIFPDYKEEFNVITGETTKVPVSTDLIEFSSGLERYCYCYQIDAQDKDSETYLKESIGTQLKDLEIDQFIQEGSYYGFDNNKLWWRSRTNDEKKEYVWGHLKTDISVNAAKTLCNYDFGGMKYYTKYENNNASGEKSTGATLFMNSLNVFEALEGVVEQGSYKKLIENDITTEFSASMQITGVNQKATLLYRGAEMNPLAQGEVYCVQFSAQEETFPTVNLWDAKSSEYQSQLKLKFDTTKFNEDKSKPPISGPITSLGFNSNISTNAFKQTMWFIVPKYVGQPHFTLHFDGDVTNLQSIYIYQFKGYNKEIEELLHKARTKSNTILGYVNGGAGTLANYVSKQDWEFDFENNLMSNGSETHSIWLGFGAITAEGYQGETYAYPLEFYSSGKYYNVYLPLNNEKYKLTKLSSYKNDKRRQISGEKSNRYSLLETIAKTFQVFTRFLVEHDSQGNIVLDNHGRPIKRFTFVNELGRRNFNGFNYGVNLDDVERSVDANNLVTKCHVESISNQYSASNLVSIQESQYNKLGMTFIYNFNYYLNRGLLDKAKFLHDYNEMLNYVGNRTAQNLTEIEQNASKVSEETMLKARVETSKLMLNSYVTTAKEELDLIGWDRFLDGETKIVDDKEVKYSGHRMDNIEDDRVYSFPYIDWTKLKRFTKTADKQWFAYQDDTVVSGTEDYLKKNGYTPVPTGFSSRAELAIYMALNYLGRADTWSTPATPPPNESWFWAKGLPYDAVENSLIKIDALQASYHAQQSELENNQERLKILEKELKTYREILDKNNKDIARKIEWFENRYRQFVTEGTWSGQDYIDADTYYLDATRAMSTSSMPKVSYNIGATDLSKIANPFNPEDTDWGREFIYDVGDTSYIKDEELFGNTEQYTMIANITSYIDLNKQDNIEMRNYETRFEELFQSVAAAVTSVQLNEDTWGRAANFMADGSINEEILQKSFNNNKNLVIASANNSVTQDNRGIIIIDNDTGKSTRLIGGGIFLSSDGGRNYKAGVTPDGINASLITAGQVDTSKIVIRSNDTPLFELNSQGLTANSPIQNRITRFDQFGIYSTDKAGRFGTDWWKTDNIDPNKYIANNSIFSLTRLGLDIKYEKGGLIFGTIGYNTDTGEANKWGLKVTKIENGEEKTTVEIDHEGNATFSGMLKAATGDFTGKITANSGQIGKWEIDSDKLYYPDDGSGIGAGFILSGSTGWNPYFYMGYNKSKNSAGTDYPSGSSSWEPFTKVEISHNGRVRIGQNSDPGQLNFSPTDGTLTIRGHIQATSGNFGGWELAQSNVNIFGKKNGSYGIGLNAEKIGTEDIAFAIGLMSSLTGSWSSAKFRVDGQGKVFCQNLKITGGEIDIGNGSFTVDNKGVMSCTGANISGESVLSSGVKLTESASIWYDDHNAIRGTYLQFGHGASRDSYDSSLFVGTLTYNDHTQSCLTSLVAHRNSYNKVYIELESGYHEAEGYLGGTWRGSSSVSVCSDRRIKHEISSLSEKYSLFFDKLCPVTYKYNNGTSDRLHTGFIAQDIQNALTLAELTTNEFAGFVISHPNTEQETYALRYEEFIALNTFEIQKLKARVAELESKLESLTSL